MRLHLLLRAGEARLAIAAERVRRVERATGQGELALSEALGRAEEPTGEEVAVELAGLPRPLRAERVFGIVDTGAATFASLPHGTRLARPALTRALILSGEVHFELAPEALAAAPLPAPAEPLPPPAPPPAAGPGQALVFRAGGRSYCAPFGLVQSVLQAPRIFDVPLAPPAHLGVLLHGGALVPVFDLPALLEGRPRAGGGFVVVVEGAGELVGLAADELRGVHRALAAPPPGDVPEAPGGAWLAGDRGEAIFLPAYDRLFGARDAGHDRA